MTRFLVFVVLAAMTALGAEIPSPSVSSDQTSLVTFNKDVLPILQKNCQACHRPGAVAPMSFLTYESTRPWARAIRTAVLSKQMPPWFADPQHGEFRNAPKLTQSDISTLAAWADSGAPEGNAAGRPAPVEWADGWRIQPDVIVSMPQPYRIKAKGEGEVRQFVIESPFKEDTWVTSIEVRPGNASVVHHVLVQVPEQTAFGKKAFRDVESLQEELQNAAVQAQVKADMARAADAAQAMVRVAAVQERVAAQAVAQTVSGVTGGVFFKLDGVALQGGGSYNDQLVRLQEQRTGQGAFTTMEAVYAPGSPPQDFRFTDSAKLIPGGRPIRLEVHYTPNGKETTDQTMVGFTLAKGPAPRRFVIMAPEHLVDDRKPIPAGEANWESRGELTFNQDADLVWFMPHMHLRGKDMTFQLIHPDGREETVLSAKFNFNWQLGYEVEKPIKVSKGTRMVVTAHHDNSANNPSNPTPNKAATWGEMTSQEMMLPWFGVVVEGDAKPEMIASYRPGFLDGPGPGPKLAVNPVPVLKR
jgi:hypothetical protein